MSQLQQYERDAITMAKRISDLKSLTPQFIDARDQAQRSMEKHYRMIEEAEADLAELRTEAAALASRLGEEMLTAPDPAEADGPAPHIGTRYVWAGGSLSIETKDGFVPLVGSVSAADAPGLADLPAEEQAQVEAILNDDTPFPGMAADPVANDHFTTVGEVAERITAALAELADDQPDTPDQTDAPELTTEQVERVEADMAAALKAYA